MKPVNFLEVIKCMLLFSGVFYEAFSKSDYMA
jgi:hypothetical protein